MEDYIPSKEEFAWELDEYHLEHLKSLGLYKDEEEKPIGHEYITRQ